MKFGLQEELTFSAYQMIDLIAPDCEITIGYDQKEEGYYDIFVQKAKENNTTLTLVLYEDRDLSELIRLNKLYPNVIKVGFFVELENLEKYQEIFKEENISFYHRCGVKDLQTFYQYIEEGVSDICLYEPLNYYLPPLAKEAKKNHITLRTLANGKINDITDFFIKPNNIPFYEDYFDIIDLDYPGNKADVILDIYRKQEVWRGPLFEIIPGMPKTINDFLPLNKEIDKSFLYSRVLCQQKCKGDSGHECRLCHIYEEIYKAIYESYSKELEKEES